MSDTYFNAVADVARVAGDFAMSQFGHDLMIDVKLDGSPVTIADRGAEERARAWIEKRFPDDGILGEEFGDVRPDARRRWIIDPIDGTKSFVRRVPLWGTLIAVTEDDTVVAGCAYFPALAENIVAAVDRGCFWNGTRCSVSDNSHLASATLLITDPVFPGHPERKRAWDRIAGDAGIVRTWGDCYGYLLLATGRAEAMVDDIASPWDAAALYPIVTEAGGVFTDWRGNATAFGGDIIATNSALASGVRSVLVGAP